MVTVWQENWQEKDTLWWPYMTLVRLILSSFAHPYAWLVLEVR